MAMSAELQKTVVKFASVEPSEQRRDEPHLSGQSSLGFDYNQRQEYNFSRQNRSPRPTPESDPMSGYKGHYKGWVATTSDGEKYLFEEGVAPDQMKELHRIGEIRIVDIGKRLPSGFEVVEEKNAKPTNISLMQLLIFMELHKTVVEFVVVERPLSTKRSDKTSGYKFPHEGCVVTTADGQKYLIEKGVAPDDMEELHRIGGEKGSRIVKIGKNLPPNFRVVRPVKIKNTDVTLMQLLEASGKDYNWLCSNCWNSTESMKRVVTGESQLSWQSQAGIAGIAGIGGVITFITAGLLSFFMRR